MTEALSDFEQYETMHVSCLVEVGTKLIMEKEGEAAAKEYFEPYECYFEEGKFERLRRITGYLVGSLERWNDGKKAEEAARVKHNVSVGQYDQATKVKREAKKASQKAAVGKE